MTTIIRIVVEKYKKMGYRARIADGTEFAGFTEEEAVEKARAFVAKHSKTGERFAPQFKELSVKGLFKVTGDVLRVGMFA